MKLFRYAHFFPMNNRLSLLYLIMMIALVFPACRGRAKAGNDNNKSEGPVSLHTGDEKYVAIDTKESVVTWKGSNSFGAHTGYVYLSKGELMIENDQLVGGTVEVDMNTIEDEKYGRDNGLVQHLKNPDFFDVKKFPTATIAITKAEPTAGGDKNITGNLTIKGITNPVGFPAKVEIKDGTVRADGKLVIDRTKWDVRYNSGKFYDNLADKTISDSIEFHVKIVAKK